LYIVAGKGFMIKIGSVQLSTIQDKVYDELLTSLLSGRISPGEKLTIESIATMMGVSLTPVRVALQRLEVENFIRIGKNRRITVTELSTNNLLELLKIRLMLECYAAEKACKYRSEESLIQLTATNEKCDASDDPDAYLLANREFHRIIYSEANMPMLEEIIGLLWKRASPYLHILLRSEDDFKAGNFNKNHKGMLTAMRQKDPREMKKWLTKDLTEAAKFVRRRLEKERISG
jgi:DNA-binding GntR family transcriptional regulator